MGINVGFGVKHIRGCEHGPGFGVSGQGQDLGVPQQGPGWVFLLGAS